MSTSRAGNDGATQMDWDNASKLQAVLRQWGLKKSTNVGDIDEIFRLRTKTYKRFLRSPQYIEWLDSTKLNHNNVILWIRGFPDAGKSKLLNFLFCTCQKERDKIVIYFKFNRHGDNELEMSAEGLYRSLLLQLLEARPDLQNILYAVRAEQPWSFGSHRSFLGQAIRALGRTSLVFFVDALEECKKTQVRDILGFMQRTCKQVASSGTVVRVCVASHPQLIDDFIQQKSELGSSGDMRAYVSTTLRLSDRQRSEFIHNEGKEWASSNIVNAARLIEGLSSKHGEEYRQKSSYHTLHGTPNDLDQLLEVSEQRFPTSPTRRNRDQPDRRVKTIKSGVGNGCNTCMKRRIWCDGGLPECTNCVRTARQCTGYGPLFRKKTYEKKHVGPKTTTITQQENNNSLSDFEYGVVTYRSQILVDKIMTNNNNDGGDVQTGYLEVACHSGICADRYVDTIVDDLYERISCKKLSTETIEKLSNILPSLLKSLALKIGHHSQTESQRDVMVFLHKQSDLITTAFRNRCNYYSKDLSYEATSTRGRSSAEMMGRWLSSAEYAGYDEASAEQPRFNAQAAQVEECENGAKLPLPKLEEYRRLIFNDSSYTWMLARLLREVVLTRFEYDVLCKIQNRIRSAIPETRLATPANLPEEVQVTYTIEWDIMLYLRQQNHAEINPEAISNSVTLTGTSEHAQALTCWQYMTQMWPLTGVQTLRLIQETLRTTQHKKTVIFTRPSRLALEAFIIQDLVIVEVSGLRDFVIEIGEQLAWLGSALRPTQPSLPPGTGVCICTPFVDHTIEVSKDEPQKLTCVIKYSIEFQPITDMPNDRCWTHLFSNPVITRGFPILCRAEPDTGLEMPLELMVALTGTKYLNTFNSHVLIKGFNTMLVPVKQSDDLLIWHLLHSQDPSQRISYLSSNIEGPNITMRALGKFRHILGWCATATSIVGTTRAMYDIEGSRLPRAHSRHTLEKVEISAGQFVTGTAAFTLGNREKPVHISRFGFLTKLQWISSRHVVLWDEGDRRGWLVNGASALLHILRASLAYSKRKFQSAWLLDPNDLEDCENPSRPDACLQVLINGKNRNLTLYMDRTEVYEEIVSEGTTTNNASRRQTRHYRLEDKIEHIYSILEKLIDHQADSERRSGLEVNIRPRRQMEGWDFKDLVKDGDPIFPRVSTLPTIGKGWVDFTRAIHAVTLFGRGFGELIQPRQSNISLCNRWSLLPKNQYYLATCVSSLLEIMEEDGDATANPRRLCENVIWHMKRATFDPCPCTKNKSHSHHDPVQALFPSKFTNSLRKKPHVELRDTGAVIFGHNMSLHWHWKDTGDPVKGDPPLEQAVTSDTIEESAIGSGLGPSKFPLTPEPSSSGSIGDRSPTPHLVSAPASPLNEPSAGSKRLLQGLVSSATKRLKQ